MKELMNISSNVVVSGVSGTDTMSSTELAALLGYEVKEVNRKIKAMFQSEIDGGEISPSLDSRGYVAEYYLPEIESNMFVGRWDHTHLRALASFWVTKKSVAALPDFTNPVVAAEAWIEQFKLKQAALEEVKVKETILLEQKPKVEFADAVTKADQTVMAFKEVAKILGLGRNTLFSILRDENVLMRNNTPYQRYVDQGYFVVKQTEHNGHLSHTTYITGKGESWMYKFLTKKGHL